MQEETATFLAASINHAQQILESRNISRFNVVELQYNQVDDRLGAPPEILVIFGASVYVEDVFSFSQLYIL